ncbi:MAG: hypothetical protein GXO42_01920 [bacterium]|nr:hypothetical protein [bacterium]
MKFRQAGSAWLGAGFYDLQQDKKEEILSWLKAKQFVQVIRGSLIVSYFHAFHALYQAWLALQEQRLIAKSFQLEILLRAAGTRQVDDALDYAGLKEREKLVCLVAVEQEKEKLEQLEQEFCRLFSAKETSPRPEKRLLQQVFGSDREAVIITRIALLNLESNARKS